MSTWFFGFLFVFYEILLEFPIFGILIHGSSFEGEVDCDVGCRGLALR